MGISAGAPIVPDAPFEILNGTRNYLGKGWGRPRRLRRHRGKHAPPGR
jgi:hypothetical protein